SRQPLQWVSGRTSISSFGSSCSAGIRKSLVFSGAVTLTYNGTSMILPGGVDYTTGARGVREAVALGGSNWRVINVTRINGQSVINPAVDVGTMLMSTAAAAPAKYVFGFG